MLNSWIRKLDAKRIERSIIVQSKDRLNDKILSLKDELDIIIQVRDVFQKAASETQQFLSNHLSAIVTNAVRSVFPEREITFHLKFVERRNSTECDLYLTEGNHEFSLFDSRGYGITDIVSFAMKVAYVILHQNENLLIIDEPFRNLSTRRYDLASKMVRTISEELNIQFIIVTHVDELKEHAHKSYEVIQNNGVSEMLLDS